MSKHLIYLLDVADGSCFKECWAPGAGQAAFVTADHAGLSHWND